MGCGCQNKNMTYDEAIKACNSCPIGIRIIKAVESNKATYMEQCKYNGRLILTLWNENTGCPKSLWGILLKPLK